MEELKSKMKGEGTAASACPYAAALQWHQVPSDADSVTTSGSTGTSTSGMIQSCPAFQNGQCPFASCTNEQEIRQMLLQIPSSHYQTAIGPAEPRAAARDTAATKDDDSTKITTPFLKVLQDIHAVAGTIAAPTTEPRLMPQKCPVFQNTTTSPHPAEDTATKFSHVIMDGYSLSEIMARLAKEMEENDEPQGETTATALSTTRTTETYDTSTTNTNDTLHTTPPQPPLGETTPPLSVTMKSGTAASHVAAENVHFVRNFIRGQIDPVLFAALTQQLYYVYRTLECYLINVSDDDEKDNDRHNHHHHQNMVHVQQFRTFHQALQRTESLQEDLDYWFGTKTAESMIQYDSNDDNDPSNPLVSPATRDYIRRIQYCAQHDDPTLLLAHSYTRYLGDLSGGKILSRVARKALQLTTGDGLAFYDFSRTIPNTKQFKDDYRRALDQLPLTTAQMEALVAEANIAFVLNMRIFEELDVRANIPGATLRPYEEAIRPYLLGTPPSSHRQRTNVNPTSSEIPPECPFANMNRPAAATTTTIPKPKGRCPWPFILFHDATQFWCDWQTWMVFGLLLCWGYRQWWL